MKTKKPFSKSSSPQASAPTSASVACLREALVEELDIATAGAVANETLGRKAAGSESDADWQRDLADGWQSVGEALEAQGDLVGAIDAFAHGAEISERLAVTDPDDAEAQRLLTVCSGKLAAAWERLVRRTCESRLSRNDTKLLSKMVLER
jgi:hypothetical protein